MKITINTADIAATIANLDEVVEEMTKKIGLDIFTNVVATTPVDTGFARNSWQLEETKEGIEVTTTCVYMPVLNNGHSKQAPAGFIEAAVDKATRL